MDPEQAVQDFHARRANYSKVYEPVSERDGPFVKIINSKQFIVNAIRGYLPLKVSDDNTLYSLPCTLSPALVLALTPLAWIIPLSYRTAISTGRALCHESTYSSPHLLFDSSWTIRVQFTRQNWW